MSANAGWFARGEHVGARGTRVAYDRVQLRVAAHGGVGVGDDDRLGGETGRQSRDGCESRDHGNTRTRCGRTWENRSRPFLPLRSSADTTAADGGPGSACAERDTDRERGHEAAVARRVEDGLAIRCAHRCGPAPRRPPRALARPQSGGRHRAVDLRDRLPARRTPAPARRGRGAARGRTHRRRPCRAARRESVPRGDRTPDVTRPRAPAAARRPSCRARRRAVQGSCPRPARACPRGRPQDR